MNPMIRRQQAAQATVDRFLGKPLSYGKDDCARMAVFCLKQLGVKVAYLKEMVMMLIIKLHLAKV